MELGFRALLLHSAPDLDRLCLGGENGENNGEGNLVVLVMVMAQEEEDEEEGIVSSEG